MLVLSLWTGMNVFRQEYALSVGVRIQASSLQSSQSQWVFQGAMCRTEYHRAHQTLRSRFFCMSLKRAGQGQQNAVITVQVAMKYRRPVSKNRVRRRPCEVSITYLLAHEQGQEFCSQKLE